MVEDEGERIEKNMKWNSMGKVFEILNLQKRANNKISVIRDKDGANYFEVLFNVESKAEERKMRLRTKSRMRRRQGKR